MIVCSDRQPAEDKVWAALDSLGSAYGLGDLNWLWEGPDELVPRDK